MPQSARLSAGGWVQWLFGQCPNELLYFYGGASLKLQIYAGKFQQILINPSKESAKVAYLCQIQQILINHFKESAKVPDLCHQISTDFNQSLQRIC